MAATWKALGRVPGGRAALGFLLFVGAVALAAPWLPLPSPLALSGQPLQPPSLSHLFGTDDLGRDVLARVAWGARTSLLVGLAAAAIATLLGGAVGSLTGYVGGWVDRVLMRLTDAMLTLPTFLVILLVIAIFRANLGLVIAIIGLTSWPQTARVARAEFLTLRERDFVVAARATGVGDARVMWRHLFPNALPAVMATAALRVGTAILTEASLGFLGASDPDAISWGQLMLNALQVMRDAWWIVAFPAAAVALTILALNVVADVSADLSTPRL